MAFLHSNIFMMDSSVSITLMLDMAKGSFESKWQNLAY